MKDIIILDRLPDAGGYRQFNICFWLPVNPVARQPYFANPAAKSAYKDATAAELTALQNGQIIERVEAIGFDQAKTLAQIQADLVAQRDRLQADLDATPKFARYGTSHDGATNAWTAGGA